MNAEPPAELTDQTFSAAVATLARTDRDLGNVVARFGPPPFWSRPPGFATLVLIILEQQVSLASARAAFERLKAAASPLTPETLLALNDDVMRAIGFSRQKMGYVRNLAQDILEGRLDLDGLPELPDAEVYGRLLRQKGIGPWTAEVYMLMALRRADMWPVGDLALVVAMQEVKSLPKRPSADEMVELAEPWRPIRAAAARILWHHYLAAR